MGEVLGAPILAESPDDWIVREPVLENSAGMIENDAIGFTRSRTQSTSYHLTEKA
jgi:hypothetical protein